SYWQNTQARALGPRPGALLACHLDFRVPKRDVPQQGTEARTSSWEAVTRRALRVASTRCNERNALVGGAHEERHPGAQRRSRDLNGCDRCRGGTAADGGDQPPVC